MLHYLIQVIAFQVLFLLIYDLLLKRETFFNYNRVYLLSTSALSFVLPLIKIKEFKSVIPQEYVVSLPEIILGESQTMKTIALSPVFINSRGYNIWLVIGVIGMLIALSIFILKLTEIFALVNNNKTVRFRNLKIVILNNSNQAYSFFNFVFLGKDLLADEKDAILNHERVHVNQKHTLDLIYFELLRILFWFNPLVYIYQKRIMTLHEFIADATAVKDQDKNLYYQNLLSQVFETKNLSFINTFFKESLIKKRIVMLTKSKSKQVKLIKYTLLIPTILVMLVYSSCAQETGAQESELSRSDESTILENIEALKESIAAKGEMTKEEQIALKELIVLTSEEGVNHQYFNDVKDKIEIPFGVIENVPVHPNCNEAPSNDDKKSCMAIQMNQHVLKNFNTKVGKESGLSGRQRISVIFKIDNKGKVVDVKARSQQGSEQLEAEAIRVIKMLPDFKPGTQKGKAVTVPYSLPIIFDIEE